MVGSLFSLLSAIVVTATWVGYDHFIGVDFAIALATLFGNAG